MTTKTKQPLGPNQQAWVDALRSGKYPQTRGALQNENGYCCLGVACAINSQLINYTMDKRWIAGGDLILQPEVHELLKLKSTYGKYDCPDAVTNTPRSLVELNDLEEWNFNQIADFIEEHAHELFYGPA